MSSLNKHFIKVNKHFRVQKNNRHHPILSVTEVQYDLRYNLTLVKLAQLSLSYDMFWGQIDSRYKSSRYVAQAK